MEGSIISYEEPGYEYQPDLIPLRELIKNANQKRLCAEEKFRFKKDVVYNTHPAKPEYDYTWSVLLALQELEQLKKLIDEKKLISNRRRTTTRRPVLQKGR